MIYRLHFVFTICTVLLFTISSQAQYSIDWTNLVSAQHTHQDLLPVNPTGWNSSGASSRSFIDFYEAGEIEFKVDAAWGDCIIGLSNIDVDQNWTSVKYGIKFNAGSIEVQQQGVLLSTISATSGIHTYSIKKDLNGIVTCYMDGVLQATYAGQELFELYVDAAFSSNSAKIEDISASFKSGHELYWKEISDVDIFIPQRLIYSTTGGPFGASGLYSLNELDINDDDFIAFSIPDIPSTPNTITGTQIIGFNPSFSSYNLWDIEFGVMVYSDPTNAIVELWEYGLQIATLPDYWPGDRIKVVLDDMSQEYHIYHNGLLVYNHPASGNIMNVICSFEILGAGVQDIVCSAPFIPENLAVVPSLTPTSTVYELDESSKLKVRYENEYGEHLTSNLIYRVFDDNMSNIAESNRLGVLSGSAVSIPVETGFNNIAFDFSSYSLTPGVVYHLEIENAKREKVFLNFKL